MSLRLARSAGVISAATLASRLLGLFRDQVLAYLFGAGHAMDAFNVAFRIPNLARDLFAEGAMSAAFVPTFTRKLATASRADAWQLGNNVINALLVTTGVLVLAGVLFADSLTALFAGNYAFVPGKLELTTTLTRIMLPFLTLVAVAAAAMGILNSLGYFFLPALSPAMFNVAVVLSAAAVPLAPRLGIDPIVLIAAGTVLGGAGQIALQWPFLRREGFRYRPILDPRDQGLRDVLLLMGPGTLGLAAVQINVFVNTVLATGEGAGAVSWLNYAFRIMYLPIGLFGVSVATAALPSLSAQAAREDLSEMRRTLSSGLRLMLMLNIPATIGLIALASPIVGLIFERGLFTTADTAATTAALLYYAPGLVGYAAVKLAVPAFYALKESRTPVAVSAATVVINVTLNLLLVRVIGYRGLALGTAIAALVNAGTLLALLRRRLGGLDERRVVTALMKILVASGVMGIAAATTEASLHAWLPGLGLLPRALRVTAAIGVGVVVLAAAARALRIREFDEAWQHLSTRLSVRTTA